MLLEELKPGLRIDGVIPAEVITVIAAQWHGTDALGADLQDRRRAPSASRSCSARTRTSSAVAQTGSRAFDAPAYDFKLVAEAQRIRLAGLFDPMLAVATSDVQPLPHQIRAVYGELLPRTPLRFLLADDPGAGKTIMAGLYIKELMLRDDVRAVPDRRARAAWSSSGRTSCSSSSACAFEILTRQLIDASVGPQRLRASTRC